MTTTHLYRTFFVIWAIAHVVGVGAFMAALIENDVWYPLTHILGLVAVFGFPAMWIWMFNRDYENAYEDGYSDAERGIKPRVKSKND